MKTVRNDGFTAVEMMVVLVIMAVVVSLAAPALTNLIRDNRMLSQVYAMRAALNTARSEALAERMFVTMCRSNDGESCSGTWNEGYIAFTDRDGDGQVDDPNDPEGDRIFVAESNALDSLTVAYQSPGDANMIRVRFDSLGYARGFGGTFTVCDERGAEKARGVIVSEAGLVRAAVVDPNEPDGIAQDREGNQLDCD